MIFHKFDDDCKLIDAIQIDLEQALVFLDEYLERADEKYTYGEEAMAATSFCISRSESDFLQINCDGKNSISFHSDRLEFDMNFLLRLFCKKTVMILEGNIDYSVKIITDFFNLSRQCFEKKYSHSYQRPTSFGGGTYVG